MRKLFTIFTLLLLTVGFAYGRKDVSVCFDKRNGHTITLDWSDGTLRWSARLGDKKVVAPSRLTMTTDRGVWGEGIKSARIERSDGGDYGNYDSWYSGAVVNFGDYSVELRAYVDGVAYRFISNIEGEYKIIDELAEFAFREEDMAWIPYVNFRPNATSDYATQFETSFENTYTHTALKVCCPKSSS